MNEKERAVIDDLIDFGSQFAGSIDFDVVHSLYRKGLIFLDVPISGKFDGEEEMNFLVLEGILKFFFLRCCERYRVATLSLKD